MATAMWAPVGSPGASYQYEGASYEPASPTPSNQSRTNRFTAWFSRSRSNSPNTQGQDDGDDNRKRSRSRGRMSRSASPADANQGTFVVRNVVKQNGGVSWDIDSQGNASPGLEYRRSKSKPIGGGMSLGVPPGGPGGGTGYGTAGSHNDGRIIRDDPQQMQMPRSASGGVSPPPRPPSPGHTKAAAFQRPHRVSPGPLSQRQHDAEMQPPRAPFATQPQYDAPGARTSPLRKPMPLPEHGQLAAGSDPFVPMPPSDSLKNHVIPGFDPTSLNPVNSASPINIPSPGTSPVRDPRRQSVADQRAANFGFIGGNEASPGTSPGLASRIKGFFGKPSRDDEDDDDDQSQDGPLEGTPYGVSPDAYNRRPMGARVWSGGQPSFDPADKEAEMLRKRSQREAARLIDEERRRIIDGSPPNVHRKAVPSLPSGLARELTVEGWTPEALNRMTESGRVDLVRRLTVKSAGSGEDDRATNNAAMAERIVASQPQIDWASLTPAQRIIAETRSRHLEQDRMASARADSGSSPSRVQRGFEASPVRGAGDASFGETPVRRNTKPSPKKKDPPTADAPASASPSRPSPSKQTAPAAIASPPAAMPSPEAPRKSVPPSPAVNGAVARKDGLAPGRGPMPTEMGGMMPALQEMMTRFYRFERYAVPLLRSLETRLVDIERDAQMAAVASADGASDRTGRSAREREMDRWVGQMTNLMKHEIGQLKAGTNEIREGRETLSALARQQAPGSSKILQQGAQAPSASATASSSAPAPQPQSHLALPPEAAPVLDKNASHTQQRSTDSQPARSTSPSGRPKYTNALGRPMVDGRVSPAAEAPRAASPQRAPSPVPSIPALPSEVTLEAEDEDEEEDVGAVASAADQTTITHAVQPEPLRASSLAALRASAGSPAVSDGGGSNASRSTSRSVNDRLKALMAPKAPTQAVQDEDDSGEVEDEASTLPPLRTMAAPTRAAHGKEASGKSYTSTSSTVTPAKLGQRPPQQQQHLVPPPARSSTAPTPRSVSPGSNFIGGRTSPSPASYAGLGGAGSASVSPISSPLNLSPSIPATAGGDISTGRFASQGLRARAQNYLGSTSADVSPSAGSTGSSRFSSRNDGISTGDTAAWASSKKEDTPPSTVSRAWSGGSGSGQTGTRKMTAPAKAPGGMTLKERVAFFEVNNR